MTRISFEVYPPRTLDPKGFQGLSDVVRDLQLALEPEFVSVTGSLVVRGVLLP